MKSDRLYKLDRAAGMVLNILAGLMLVLLIIWGVCGIQTHRGVTLSALTCWPLLVRIFRYTWYVSLSAAAVAVVVRVLLSPFVKSEEQELFEKQVDYVLSQRQAATSPKEPVPSPPADYSPLRNLTPEQEQAVLQLLRELPSHPKKPEAIKMADLAHYLMALEQLGKANLCDKHNLRLWAAQVTGRTMPETSPFNDALTREVPTKIKLAKKKIELIIR